jgi:urease accessory protein
LRSAFSSHCHVSQEENASMTVKYTVQDLEKEIYDLEYRLQEAKARLAQASGQEIGGDSYLPLPQGT